MINPVDDSSFTRPLVKALRGHVDAFAASMAGPKPGHGQLDAVRPAAVSWVYYSVLVAWAEDHGLIDPWLRVGAKDRRETFAVPHAGGMVGWLARAYASLCVHPATWCLLDPRYTQLRDHTPSQDVCQDLVDWWTSDAPSLAYEVENGPTSISGWLPGDMLQALSAERVKANAFCQTPWWVADGILDLSLVPAAGEFRGETLKTIDPTCGTGHMVIRTIDYLWEWYTTGALAPRQMKTEGVTGGEQFPPAEAIRRIIAGTDGCELDPLTAAVARLRVIVAVGDLMHRSGMLPTLRLDTIPPFQPRIVVGDSLLAGVISAADYAALHPKLADIQNLGYATEPEAETPTPRSTPPVNMAPHQPSLFDLEGAA